MMGVITGGKRDRKGRDDGSDESLETPLNKGFLLKKKGGIAFFISRALH